MKFPLIKFNRENSKVASSVRFCSLLSSFRSLKTTEGLEGCQFACASSKDELIRHKFSPKNKTF